MVNRPFFHLRVAGEEHSLAHSDGGPSGLRDVPAQGDLGAPSGTVLDVQDLLMDMDIPVKVSVED